MRQPGITERPEPAEVLRQRARSSAEEFQRIAVTISSGALGVFFIALTQKVEPALTTAERGWLLASIAAMAISTFCAVVTWFADARWNARLALAKETTSEELRARMLRATRVWRGVELTAGMIFLLAFGPGLFAVGIYLWLRAK